MQVEGFGEKQKVTLNDIAKKACVSVATVSRVLNGNSSVNQSIKSAVQKACADLSYVQSRSAKKKKTIGFVLPSLADTFFSHVAENMSACADERGFGLLVLSSHGNPENEPDCLRSAFDANVDGLLYCPSAEAGISCLRSLFAQEFPLVIYYRRAVMQKVPHIFYNNEQGGYLATKYLLHQGRRKIAFFGSFWNDVDTALLIMQKNVNQGFYSALDRLSGYLQALKEFSIEAREELLLPVTGFDFESGKNAAKRFLSRVCDFDAIFCSNDAVAAGVIAALQEQHYTVPETVSVIGYDDSAFATAARPTLTTIRQDPAVLAERAIGMIDSLINAEQVYNSCLDVTLVVRNSTAVKTPSGVV